MLIDDKLLLDYGMNPSNPSDFPIAVAPDTTVISHAHLDHSGFAAALRQGKVFMTPVTKDLSYLLGEDTIKIGNKQGSLPFTRDDLDNLMRRAVTVPYNERFTGSGYEIELYDAGHIPGGASIYVGNDLRLFYTSDIKMSDTKLLNKADDIPEADILIVESTYFGKSHTPRGDLERKFVESIGETLDRGGNAIVPCFAIGRTQEIVMVLHASGIVPYVDGMGTDVQKILESYPSFIRDFDMLKDAFENVRYVNPSRRYDALREPSVIVTTAGMLNGGPVLYYLRKAGDDERNKVLLTGYQLEDTNGRRALEEGYVLDGQRKIQLNLDVEQYDFSSHSDDSELKELVSRFCDGGTEITFTVHGDDCEGFADWIRKNCKCDAFAPELGDEFIIY